MLFSDCTMVRFKNASLHHFYLLLMWLLLSCSVAFAASVVSLHSVQLGTNRGGFFALGMKQGED